MSISVQKQIVSINEIAQYLGISRASVYKLIKDKPPLPTFMLNGRRLFSIPDVSNWLIETGRIRASVKPLELEPHHV